MYVLYETFTPFLQGLLQILDTLLLYFLPESDNEDNYSKTPTVNVTVDNTYNCQYCGQKFPNYFKLKTHMLQHKDEQVCHIVRVRGHIFWAGVDIEGLGMIGWGCNWMISLTKWMDAMHLQGLS